MKNQEMADFDGKAQKIRRISEYIFELYHKVRLYDKKK